MLFSIDQLHKVSFFIGGRLGEQLGALMNCNLLLITNSEDDLESKRVATWYERVMAENTVFLISTNKIKIIQVSFEILIWDFSGSLIASASLKFSRNELELVCMRQKIQAGEGRSKVILNK